MYFWLEIKAQAQESLFSYLKNKFALLKAFSCLIHKEQWAWLWFLYFRVPTDFMSLTQKRWTCLCSNNILSSTREPWNPTTSKNFHPLKLSTCLIILNSELCQYHRIARTAYRSKDCGIVTKSFSQKLPRTTHGTLLHQNSGMGTMSDLESGVRSPRGDFTF